MKKFFRIIFPRKFEDLKKIQEDENVRTLENEEAIETWIVSWVYYVKPHFNDSDLSYMSGSRFQQAFSSRSGAEKYSNSLKEAFKHTKNNWLSSQVRVYRMENS